MKLLNIERHKVLNYTPFWTLLILHGGLFLMAIFLFLQFEVNLIKETVSIREYFQFPHIWQSMSWVASWFNLFLPLIIIALIGNEYSFKTFRQHQLHGLNRSELVSSKLLVILGLAIYSLVLVFVLSLIIGFIFTDDLSQGILKNSSILGVFFIQTIAYMLFGMLFAILLRRTAISMILFILYIFPTEILIRYLVFGDTSIRHYFPWEIVSDLVPRPELLGKYGQDFENMYSSINYDLPELSTNIMFALGYMGIFIFLFYYLIKKRNL